MKITFNLLASCLLLLMVSGCVPLRKGGTTHYLVIGFGVVSVNNTNEAVAKVVRMNAVGITGSQHGLTVGYAGSSTISVNTNENVLVEVQNMPGKPLTVCVPSSQ